MRRNAPGEAAGLPVEAGLCRSCRHAEAKRAARSVFLRCRLADSDPRYSKYPQLPVLACSGFESRDASDDAACGDC